jgi:hypothetical protein
MSDRWTVEDLVAVSMLGVSVPARAAVVLTEDGDGTFQRLLAAIPTDLSLQQVSQPLTDAVPAAAELDKRVDALAGLGRTTTSKLLARKRPHLLPVIDSVTMAALGRPRHFWEPLRRQLRDSGLAAALTQLGRDADVPAHISVLRVLDVTLWMRHRRQPATPTARR